MEYFRVYFENNQTFVGAVVYSDVLSYLCVGDFFQFIIVDIGKRLFKVRLVKIEVYILQ